jgi:hypothetical protein
MNDTHDYIQVRIAEVKVSTSSDVATSADGLPRRSKSASTLRSRAVNSLPSVIIPVINRLLAFILDDVGTLSRGG